MPGRENKNRGAVPTGGAEFRGGWRVAAGAAGTFLLFCLGFLIALYAIGVNDGLYHRLQMRANVLDGAGIDEETLVRLDAALADCLKGDPAWNAPGGSLLTARVFGAEQPAFNERERIHMEDCGRLFALLRRAIAAFALAGTALSVLGLRRLSGRKRRRAVRIAAGLLLATAGVFIAWAALDFDSAFNAFHGALFTNDLWLMDPRTDLLIRICPESMFRAMGAAIALLGGLWCLAAGIACARLPMPGQRE